MEEEVEKISSQIVRAVKTVMNVTTSASDRRNAHEFLDNFKDTSPLCAKCGFFLSSKTHDPIFRHCGFQLIDNYIKLRWNSISYDEKLWIRKTVIRTLASGVGSVPEEEVYIKDAISRIVVELIKREWPQQWSSLMDELHELCCMGDIQKELVLLTFSRLADDIVQFCNVPDQRRREIYKALCSHLSSLFTFFWKTLSEECEKYLANKCSNILDEETFTCCRLTQVTLDTLSTFVDWVPVTHITENRALLSLLCKLLSFDDLRIPAVMCLMNIVDRRGKPEDRKELLILFEEVTIFHAISSLDVYSPSLYLFFKDYLQCLLSLGTILCNSMAQFSVGVPENFSLFLNCVLTFTRHPSVKLCELAQCIWTHILRSPELSTSAEVHSLVPTVLKYLVEKLIKCGYPSKNDCQSCKFSQLEFDSDEEFELFFSKCRADVGVNLKLIAQMQPKVTFSLGSILLKSLLRGEDWKIILDSPLASMDLVTCWEAIVTYIDATCLPLMKNINIAEELLNEGLELLNLVINFTSEDAVILSFSLSCISSLFLFIVFQPNLKLPVFEKIFSNLTSFKKGDPRETKDVMNLRRHASSLLIKLSMNNPTLLLPEFDYLCDKVRTLLQSSEYLTRFDKCALLEALMILSNHFCDFDKQTDFLKATLQSIDHIWMSPDIIQGIESPEAFISFLEVDKPCRAFQDSSPVNKNSSDLMLAINVLKACAKRCVCPTDANVAQKGKFIHPLSDSFGCVYYRNPAAQFVILVIDKVIQIIKILNALHDPFLKQRFDPTYSTILDLTDTDKVALLGTSFIENHPQERTPAYHMRLYLQNLYDACLHILGDSIQNFGIDFYIIPDLPAVVKGSILHKIEHMPVTNLRCIIRLFLKPFFLWCPPRAYDNLMVVLADLCPFMLQKLNGVWEKFKRKYGTCIDYEDKLTEIEEMLEDQLNRLLTKEYISFLGEILTKQNTCSVNEDSMDDDCKEATNNHYKVLTELGSKIIQTESVRAVFICTAFDSLRWLDTTTNIKAVQLCELVFNKMIEHGLVRQIQEANYLLQSVLYGIQELGQHDANLGMLLPFGLNVYESLRFRFPDIHSVLMNSVACDQQSMRKLHDVLNQNSMKSKSDKQKKEAFKRTIENIIGKNIGQYHKKDVVIKDLPPLICFKQKENSSLLDFTLNDDIGLCSLFSPNDKNS